MIYSEFKNKKLPLLGFGTMRLPVRADGEIDRKTFQMMVDYAMENGVNYFDTAWPYHSGLSETELGLALKKYPRDSYYIATKYPGHQVSKNYDPAAVFERQLEKCGVDYFDFYLLHNVYENSLDVYMDEKWGIFEYFKEQKKLGRIKHLGFSTHATTETMEKILDVMGDDMEFCQIQLNYVDYTLQDGIGKIKLLSERNIPIWVMEPVRGGKLCRLSDKDETVLRDLRP
ncbi:MAG: aldo/keto reductase, partial [Clostridia bacterium]|nr:aldo/keto reductase [Clostridia bacterium]